MKKIQLSILFVFIYFSNVSSQNYQTLNSGRVAFYKGLLEEVKSIKIDSVKMASEDSVFYPMKVIKKNEINNCFSPIGNSWIGNKVIIKKNLENVFINEKGDSIHIKTDAVLNENWVAFSINDTVSVAAKVILHDTATVLGQLDSVKTIQLTVYNILTSKVVSNKLLIAISKNYGFTKTFDFDVFISQLSYLNYIDQVLTQNVIVGLSKPKLGIQNLTWFNVHDFQIGDEIHVNYINYAHGPDFPNSDENIKTINRYLDRKNYQDSIVYSIERNSSRHYTYDKVLTYTRTSDTIKTVILKNEDFDKLPRTPIIGQSINDYFMTYNNNLSKSYSHRYFSDQEGCYMEMLFFGPVCSPDEYTEGLGGPYYECRQDGGALWELTSSQLAYYKKGAKTYGTALVLTGISEQNLVGLNITLFPNPVKEKLTIKLSNSTLPCIFELFDLNGKLMKSKVISAEEEIISVLTLNQGLYMYKFSTENNVFKIGKLLIE
jgi:hypothetical protein